MILQESLRRLKINLAVGTRLGRINRIADRVVIMENGEKVAVVQRHAMTARELEYVIRDGGRQGAA